MTASAEFAAGNYRFIPAVFQYSGGAAANDGYDVERVRFRDPVTLREGFARIEKIIRDAGRPLTSFCACELRSPAPFTEDGFRAFNQIYVVTLKDWGLFDGTVNPVARSNVVIAGSGEAREAGASYRERTVRRGEQSPDAMREKARYVLGEMERRLGILGFTRADTTPTPAYNAY